MIEGGERSKWLIIVFLGLIFLCTAAIGYRGAIRSVDAMLPITVAVEARDFGALPSITLAADTVFPPAVNLDPSPNGRWRISRWPVRELRLHLPANWRAWLDRVTIQIGSKRHAFDRAQFESSWQQIGPKSAIAPDRETWIAPAARIANPGVMAAHFGALNWPGDGNIAFRALALPVILTLLIALAAYLGPGVLSPPSRWLAFKAAYEPFQRPSNAAARRDYRIVARAWAAFGLGIIASAFILLQRIDPYYFVQDDNLTQFLPVVLHGCELLNHDFWPDYNLYQLMGAPMASVGVYALSYPLLWASCVIADGVLDINTAVFDVYAAIHLALGFIASFALGRRQGLSAPLAMAFGLSFALCGFFLIGGRSWYYMLPVATWLPALLLSATILPSTRRPFRWIVGTGMAFGLFFHAGNAQMWTYAGLAWAAVIGLDWFAGRLDWRRLVWAGAAAIFGLGVAAPLLVPQFAFVSRMARQAADGNGIWNGIGALFLPYPLVQAGHPNGWGDSLSGTMSQFYYSGTILTITGAVAIAALIGLVLRGRVPGRYLARPWPLLALVALVLSLGAPAMLWPLLDTLPVFRHFTHPFKLLPFLVLFINLSGALALQAWLARRNAWHLGIGLMVAVLMLWHVALAQQSFFTFADDPYLALPAPIASVIAPKQGDLDARTMSATPVQWPAPGFTRTVSNNFPTRHGVIGIDGYGSMVWFSPENMHVLRKFHEDPTTARRRYGTRWLVRYNAPRNPEDPVSNTGLAWDGSPLALAYRPVFRGDHIVAKAAELVLYDLGPADPMAFFADDSANSLPAKAEGTRVLVDLPPLDSGRTVILNFLHRPGTWVTADGETIETSADGWGRVIVNVAPGNKQLTLGYDGGWGRGLFYGIVLLLVAMAIAVVVVNKDPNSFNAGNEPDSEHA